MKASDHSTKYSVSINIASSVDPSHQKHLLICDLYDSVMCSVCVHLAGRSLLGGLYIKGEGLYIKGVTRGACILRGSLGGAVYFYTVPPLVDAPPTRLMLSFTIVSQCYSLINLLVVAHLPKL